MELPEFEHGRVYFRKFDPERFNYNTSETTSSIKMDTVQVLLYSSGDPGTPTPECVRSACSCAVEFESALFIQ